MRSVVIGATIASLLIVGAVSYYFLIWLPRATPESTPPATQSPPPTTQPPPTTEPPPATQSPPSFEQKMENFLKEVEDAHNTGESRKISLVITEDEANSEIAPRLAQVELPEDIPLEVESVHIDFQPDLAVTTLKGTAYGIALTVEVKAQVSIQDGEPKVEVIDVDFGWLPLPEVVKDQITSLLTQKIEDLQTTALNEAITAYGDMDWEVTEVNIQETQVAITLIVRPKTS